MSLRENIDTTSTTGRAFVGLIGVVNQLELELWAERVAAGRVSAKGRGRSGGRPRTPIEKLEQARILYEQPDGKTGMQDGKSRKTDFFRLRGEMQEDETGKT